jgi:hypothetical protein
MFDESRWQMSMAELKWNLQQPGVLAIWDAIQTTLSAEFVALVEEILGEEPKQTDPAQ